MSEEFEQSRNYESIILKPYTHLFNNSKKPQIAGFIEAINDLIKAPQEALEFTNEVVCIVERSLFLTDDILDNSKFRGYHPTAHEVFGVPHTLAASWYSMFMAIEKLLALKQPKIVELLVKNLKVIYEAQTMEFLWRDSFQCPTEEEYHQMTIKKTGTFLRICTDLLQLFVKDERDLTKLTNLLGHYIQAKDDLGDLQPFKVASYSEDINEGKFGFPLVVAINRHPEKLDKCEIATRMADKNSRGSYIQSLLKESDALVCCQEIISELEAEILMELNALGGSAMAESLLLKIKFIHECMVE